MRRRRPFAAFFLPSAFLAVSLVSACQGSAPEPLAQSSAAVEEAPPVDSIDLDGISWRQVTAPYPLQEHAVVALDDGRVLVTGGLKLGNDLQETSDVAYVFAPGGDTWTALPSMHDSRASHSATKLQDGRVLVFGGTQQGADTHAWLSTSELFDPVTSTWTKVVSNPMIGREGHAAVLLQDGNVISIGGHYDDGVANHVDIFDPNDGPTGSWGDGPWLEQGRVGHTATLLPSGSVLVAGGHDPSYYPTYYIYELADPHSGGWSQLSTLAQPRVNHTATLLADGRVLFAGGRGFSSEMSSVEILGDAPEGPIATLSLSVGAGSSMYFERALHTAALLPDGRVIVVGGRSMNGPTDSTEIYDPQTNEWSFGPNLNVPRSHHSMVVLPGRIIVVGGLDQDWNPLASVELLEFGKELGEACSEGLDCLSGHCIDGVCCDTSCEGACVACTAALKGSGEDGTCGTVAEGTNPRSFCEDEGAASCGTTGVCDANGSCAVYDDGTECAEGMSCKAGECVSATTECTGKSDGAVCSAGGGCTLGLCRDGACVETHKLDGTRCEGGVCIAGECKLDREATPSGAGGQGPGSDGDDPNGQGRGGSRQGAADGEDGGGGCSLAPSASRKGTFATGFALLAAIGLLRRHRSVEG